MCQNCNYEDILESVGVVATGNRLHVLETVGNNISPLTATDIFHIVGRVQSINRVTVYRILDLLVEKGIVEKLQVGKRAAYYGLAPNKNHAPHPHFYCLQCGQVDCLQEDAISVDAAALQRTFAGEIVKVEVRVDGVCKNCLKLR